MEQIELILITALAPIIVLAFYIYRKDKTAPEPIGQLLKALAYGVLSAFVSFCMSLPFGSIGLYPQEIVDVLGGIRVAFFGAAIPEEIAKFFMLWLFLRKCAHFDEKMDGIVYAVCISLGFAAFENILYLLGNSNDFLQLGISRAIFAVPGHFCFGVLMGYYYSLARFCPTHKKRHKALILIAPILAHGIYDAILLVTDVTPTFSGILSLLFYLFCFLMWKRASKSIEEHVKTDAVL